eukprot:454224-Rhodomonas_salina.3
MRGAENLYKAVTFYVSEHPLDLTDLLVHLSKKVRAYSAICYARSATCYCALRYLLRLLPLPAIARAVRTRAWRCASARAHSRSAHAFFFLV